MAFKNSTFLITGGSSGLGEAAARVLLEEGANVVVFDMQPPLSSASEEKNLLFIKGDVTSESDVISAVHKVKETFETLKGIINCAGICTLEKVYNFEKKEPHDLKNFENIIRVNTIGTFNVIRLFVSLLAENAPNQDGERGVIINVASITAFDWISGTAAYAASKAAVVGMTMPLARDLADQGIRVIAIAPGLFHTPLVQHLYSNRLEMADNFVFPKAVPLPKEFGRFVKTVIETPMLNATTVRLDGGMRDLSLSSDNIK